MICMRLSNLRLDSPDSPRNMERKTIDDDNSSIPITSFLYLLYNIVLWFHHLSEAECFKTFLLSATF